MLQQRFKGEALEAGVDEAGRGCLAGSVFAASVILPFDFYHPLIQDSKKLSPRHREKARKVIEREAISFAVENVEPKTIDEINILQASILAMQKSLDRLNPKPTSILVDGNYFKPYGKVPHTCMVKGDSRFLSIAAASILAKTYRDDYMQSLHTQFPWYEWEQNKGYPTLKHRKAIKQYGLSIHHRKSFSAKLIFD